MVRLEGAVDVHADIAGLLVGELGDHTAEALHHVAGHFLVQMLGQHFHLEHLLLHRVGVTGVALVEQVHLRQHLVGEGAVHDAAGVTGGVAQVDQAAFREQQQEVLVFLVAPHFMNLGLHFFPFPGLAHEGGVHFVVEVADVADHRAFFQRLEHVGVAHVVVAGGGDQHVGGAQQLLVDGRFGAVVDAVLVGADHFEAVHAGLHGADRIDLGDLHDHAFLTQGLRGALAHVAVADHQRFLAGKQVVGGALDGVVERVTATVLVVVLALGDRVVDVHRRHFQGALLEHLVEAVHAGGGLFGDAVDLVQHLRVGLVDVAGQVAAVIQNHVGVPQIALAVAAGLLDAPHVLFLGLALPGEHRHAGGGHGGGGVVLGGEDVAAGPAHLGAEAGQRLDQHCGLHGHVQRAGDPRALERLDVGVFVAQRHQAGHFMLSQADLLAAEFGQRQVGDLEVDAVADLDGHVRCSHIEPLLSFVDAGVAAHRRHPCGHGHP
mgnify:CR=1 FL=1